MRSKLRSKERIIVSTSILESLAMPEDSDFSSSDEFADGLVSRALNRLNSLDKDIIERYYYQGESVVDIANRYQVLPQKIEEKRKRALESIQEYLRIEANCLDLNSSHNNCALCDHGESIEINRYIRDLLEVSGFKFYGVRKRILAKFKFHALSIQQLHDHVEHMGRLPEKDIKDIIDEGSSGDKISLNFVVPLELKEKAEDIAALCGVNYIAILKMSVVEGLDSLEKYLIHNAEFSRRAAAVHRKLRKMDI